MTRAIETIEIMDIGTPAFPGRVVHLGEGVAGRVIESGLPLVIEDYERWPGKISGEVDGPPIVSALAVPLRNGATPIGAMTAHSTTRRFTKDDAHVLEVFADIAMLALSHFSMHAELRTMNSRLGRRVRERTRALQRSSEEISRKNEQLEELILGIGRAQNEERRRIAQDIHDSVMQTLTGSHLRAEGRGDDTGAAALAPRLGTVRDLLHRLEAELRSVIQDLQPVELERGGLVLAIQNEARDLQSRFGIRCRLRTLGRQRMIPQPVEVAALRIVKEALGNVQRHASAALADVELKFLKNEIQILVRDYGDGFESRTGRRSAPPSGHQRHATSRGVGRGLVHAGIRPGSRDRDRRQAADMSEPIRIVVADDHAVVRQGIRSLLEQQPDLLVVEEASCANEVLLAVAACDPDVALIDICLSGTDATSGIDVARRLRRAGPRPRIAVITAFDDGQYIFDAMHAGVDAYILKTVSEDVLADAIRAIHAGERFVSDPILGSVLSQFGDLARWRVQHESGLSDDDLSALRMLADGATTAEISAALFCSEPTSKRRLRVIFEKLSVATRTQAVVEAMRRGLI